MTELAPNIPKQLIAMNLASRSTKLMANKNGSTGTVQLIGMTMAAFLLHYLESIVPTATATKTSATAPVWQR